MPSPRRAHIKQSMSAAGDDVHESIAYVLGDHGHLAIRPWSPSDTRAS